MADVKLNPVFEAFAKQIGDLVFYKVNGKTFVRRKGNPGNPKTAAQMCVRNSLSGLVTDWSSTDGIMHRGWTEWAAKKKKKGNNAFVSQNFEKQRQGLPIELFRQVGSLKLAQFSAEPGAAGSINCSFNVAGGSAGRYLYIFTRPRIDDFAAGELVMHSAGVNPDSPYTVSGLDAGAEYFVYAVVTDAEYSDATEVSASAGVIASAGY